MSPSEGEGSQTGSLALPVASFWRQWVEGGQKGNDISVLRVCSDIGWYWAFVQIR